MNKIQASLLIRYKGERKPTPDQKIHPKVENEESRFSWKRPYLVGQAKVELLGVRK
jgi:hypothetical protein